MKKYVCLPYLKFSDPLPETLFFYLALWSIGTDRLISVISRVIRDNNTFWNFNIGKIIVIFL